MKKLFVFLVSILILFGMIAIPLSASASTYDQNTQIILPANEIVNKDYFAAGQTVIVSGTVNGDAYVAGGNVIVNGVINGDLLAAGGTVTIRGKVTQDVRVAGGQITILGTIGRNVTTVGGSVTISDPANIHGSLTAGTGDLTILAPVGNGATIGSGQLTIDNTITKDVQAGVGQLTLTPNAKVLGNLTYWSSNTARIDASSSISGEVKHIIPPVKQVDTKTAQPAIVAVGSMLHLISFLAALLMGFIIITLVPIYSKQTTETLLSKPLQSLGIGFLSMVLAPIIFIFLLITVIGIPFDLILLAGFLSYMYLAKIFVGIAIGMKVTGWFNKTWHLGWTMVIGLVIYYVVSLIPLLGFIFWMIAGLLGLGAIIIQNKTMYTQFREKSLI